MFNFHFMDPILIASSSIALLALASFFLTYDFEIKIQQKPAKIANCAKCNSIQGEQFRLIACGHRLCLPCFNTLLDNSLATWEDKVNKTIHKVLACPLCNQRFELRGRSSADLNKTTCAKCNSSTGELVILEKCHHKLCKVCIESETNFYNAMWVDRDQKQYKIAPCPTCREYYRADGRMCW